MKISEWIVILLISALFVVVINLIGFDTSILDSIPGVLILVAISVVGYLIHSVIPYKKIPMITYVALLATLSASPISPVAEFVITHVGRIGFTAPSSVAVGFIGISLGTKWKPFVKQGPKFIIVGILVFAGTFIGSAIVSQIVLKLTGAI